MKFQEFPKWIVHPETGETLVVDDAKAEEQQMSDWGFVPAEEHADLPQIDLSKKPADEPKADEPKDPNGDAPSNEAPKAE